MSFLSSTLYWWFSVFFVGICVSLVAAYLKPIVDRLVLAIWVKARGLSYKWQSRWRQDVEELARDPELRYAVEHEILTKGNERVYSLLFGFFLALMSISLLIINALLVIIGANIEFDAAIWPYLRYLAMGAMIVGFLFVISAAVNTSRLNRMKEKLAAARKWAAKRC